MLNAAALRIRTAAKLGGSIDAILEQHNNDPMILLCGKLAIAHFICQAEAKSTLRQTPRIEGDLPLQGTEIWLYQMATLITAGVPRRQAERCLDDLTIISFNYDRSLRAFPAACLCHGVRHDPAGSADVDRGQAEGAAPLWLDRPAALAERRGARLRMGHGNPWNIHNLAAHIKTLSEQQNNRQLIMGCRMRVGQRQAAGRSWASGSSRRTSTCCSTAACRISPKC